MDIVNDGKFCAYDLKAKYKSRVCACARFVLHCEKSNVKAFAIEIAVQWPIPEGIGAGIEERARFGAVCLLPVILHRALRTGFANRNAYTVPHHCGRLTAQLGVLFSYKGVAEQPHARVLRDGNRISIIGAEPSLGIAEGGQRKELVAFAGRSLTAHARDAKQNEEEYFHWCDWCAFRFCSAMPSLSSGTAPSNAAL